MLRAGEDLEYCYFRISRAKKKLDDGHKNKINTSAANCATCGRGADAGLKPGAVAFFPGFPLFLHTDSGPVGACGNGCRGRGHQTAMRRAGSPTKYDFTAQPHVRGQSLLRSKMSSRRTDKRRAHCGFVVCDDELRRDSDVSRHSRKPWRRLHCCLGPSSQEAPRLLSPQMVVLNNRHGRLGEPEAHWCRGPITEHSAQGYLHAVRPFRITPSRVGRNVGHS